MVNRGYGECLECRVKEGQMGVNRAALELNIPKTTLKDHLSGQVQLSKLISRASYT